MNTRLSQRVYSEAALEFWLQRLGDDWERKFSEEELLQGRRLYRQGSVRQLELGDTDAIVHIRVEGAEEAYVVLDWQGKDLSIRASVEDQRQRRLLAVVGLYEVEELVGDEAPALEPDIAKAPSVSADSASGAATTDAQHPAGTAADAGAGKATTDNANAATNAVGGSGSATGKISTDAATASRGTGNVRDSGNAHGTASGNKAGSADSTTAATGATAGDATGLQPETTDSGENSAEADRRLELHFSLRQGSLSFRAGWRQQGRKRLVPALGQSAPSAESMSAQEREMLIRLASLARRGGFRYDKGQGGYRLDNAERMEQFVGKELGGWSEFFDVTQETDVSLLARGVQEVSLRARIGENAEGNLSLHWMAGFEQDLPGSEYLPAFTAAERRRLLRAGASPLLLPGRGLVRLSAKQAKASEQLADAVSLFPGGTAPRYLLFSLTGLSDLPVEISASLQRWRQSVLGGNLDPGTPKKRAAAKAKKTAAAGEGSDANAAHATATGAADSNAATGETASAAVLPLPEFLRPYQRLGVGWMRHLFERGCHGLLADEMGLGKTVQVLSLIASGGQTDKASLVVCPASVVPVWQAQAAQFFPHLKVRVLGAGCTFVGEQSEPTDLWLASYTQLRRHKSQLEQVQFTRAILDEAQFIKNPEAKVTQACLSLKADHRLALSGTPLENRYLDVWTLFRFLMPGLLGTRRRFEESLVVDEAKTLVTLRKQLAPFILRRTKNEVASELPEKVELDLYCPLSDMQRTEYRRLLTEGMALYKEGDRQKAAVALTGQRAGTVAARDADANGDAPAAQSELSDSDATGDDHDDAAFAADATGSNHDAAAGAEGSAQPGLMSVLTLLTRLRQVSCDPALLPWMQEAGLHHSGKLNLLRDRLGEVFANGKKAVVFSQFVKFLDRAKQAIAADYPDVPIYQLIGTTRDRTRPVERFQSQEGAGVMLVSLKAGGTGITLHAADYVFLLDPWWNPAVEAQAVDRVHRIGQVNRVFVYRMVTAETVEARIAALKQAKRERFEQIISGASGSDDFREAFRSLESLLGLLKDSDAPQAAAGDDTEDSAPAEEHPNAVAQSASGALRS